MSDSDTRSRAKPRDYYVFKTLLFIKDITTNR